MLKPKQVPECVWRAAMSTYHKTLRNNPSMAWQEAVVAMVNAWPDRAFVPWRLGESYHGHEIRIPITVETPWDHPQENEQ